MSLKRYRTVTGSPNSRKQFIADGKAILRLAVNIYLSTTLPYVKGLLDPQRKRYGKRRVPIVDHYPERRSGLKAKHSGFYCTCLDLVLAHLGATSLILTGLTRDICVQLILNLILVLLFRSNQTESKCEK